MESNYIITLNPDEFKEAVGIKDDYLKSIEIYLYIKDNKDISYSFFYNDVCLELVVYKEFTKLLKKLDLNNFDFGYFYDLLSSFKNKRIFKLANYKTFSNREKTNNMIIKRNINYNKIPKIIIDRRAI